MSSTRPLRLLILEDDKDTSDTLAFLLREHGHQVVAVINGESGLEALHNEPFDGILVDLMLPDMNGWEFLEMMDKLPVDRKAPVIITSGYADVLPPSPWHDVPVMRKPYEFGDLLKAIEQHFAGEKENDVIHDEENDVIHDEV